MDKNDQKARDTLMRVLSDKRYSACYTNANNQGSVSVLERLYVNSSLKSQAYIKKKIFSTRIADLPLSQESRSAEKEITEENLVVLILVSLFKNYDNIVCQTESKGNLSLSNRIN